MDLEGENIVLIVTFLLLISLVYATGFIVWVCCRRSETSQYDIDVDQKRSMFPTASPAQIPQTMTSQNFPLHALVLLLIALTERTNSWNARIHHPDDENEPQNNGSCQRRDDDVELGPNSDPPLHVLPLSQGAPVIKNVLPVAQILPVPAIDELQLVESCDSQTPSSTQQTTISVHPTTTSIQTTSISTQEASTMTTYFYEVSLV